MFGNFYEGMVPMNPKMEKKDFISEEEFTYPVPSVYFECAGEKPYDSSSAFGWGDDSVTWIKGRNVIKFTESTYNDVLVTDENGENVWLENREADICGFQDSHVNDVIARRRMTVEVYDIDKAEKRLYKVAFERTLPFESTDKYFLEKIMKMEESRERSTYMLTED